MNKRAASFVLSGLALLLLGGMLLYQVFDVPPLNPQPKTTAAMGEQAAETSPAIVNLNTAGIEELMQLDGIGQAKAQSILAYREAHGNFTDSTQLMDVKGIGEGLYEQIAPYVTIEDVKH